VQSSGTGTALIRTLCRSSRPRLGRSHYAASWDMACVLCWDSSRRFMQVSSDDAQHPLVSSCITTQTFRPIQQGHNQVPPAHQRKASLCCLGRSPFLVLIAKVECRDHILGSSASSIASINFHRCHRHVAWCKTGMTIADIAFAAASIWSIVKQWLVLCLFARLYSLRKPIC
jgi:hypothetical protein